MRQHAGAAIGSPQESGRLPSAQQWFLAVPLALLEPLPPLDAILGWLQEQPRAAHQPDVFSLERLDYARQHVQLREGGEGAAVHLGGA